MQIGDPVVVQFYKHPRTLHWRLEQRWLGEDDHGIWTVGLAGDVIQKGSEPARVRGSTSLVLTPPGAWWVASWVPEHPTSPLFVDVTTPVEWHEDRIEMIDLDLDVVADRDGSVYVEDEDEFAVHQKTLGYPPEWVRAARATTDQVYEAVLAGREPFGGIWGAWLEKARSIWPD